MNEQVLDRVADAGPLRLRVDADLAGDREVCGAIDVELADALEMLDDRESRLPPRARG